MTLMEKLLKSRNSGLIIPQEEFTVYRSRIDIQALLANE